MLRLLVAYVANPTIVDTKGFNGKFIILFGIEFKSYVALTVKKIVSFSFMNSKCQKMPVC